MVNLLDMSHRLHQAQLNHIETAIGPSVVKCFKARTSGESAGICFQQNDSQSKRTTSQCFVSFCLLKNSPVLTQNMGKVASDMSQSQIGTAADLCIFWRSCCSLHCDSYPSVKAASDSTTSTRVQLFRATICRKHLLSHGFAAKQNVWQVFLQQQRNIRKPFLENNWKEWRNGFWNMYKYVWNSSKIKSRSVESRPGSQLSCAPSPWSCVPGRLEF